jgi:pre-rRNA-processing protein TSR2
MTVANFTVFCEGIALMLRRWTALQLAIEHEMAGPSSALKQTELYEEITSYFREEGLNVSEEDLDDSLYWYFKDTFCLELEDYAACINKCVLMEIAERSTD